MRIAVCDLSVGDLDILDLDKEAEDLFYEYDDAIDFLLPLDMIKLYFMDGNRWKNCRKKST